MPPRASSRVASVAASATSDTKPGTSDAKDSNSAADQNNNNNTTSNENSDGNEIKRDSASVDPSVPAADENANAQEKQEDGEGGSGTKMRKRRLDVNPSLIISEERSKRRRTPSHEPEDVKPNGAGRGGDDDAADPKDPQRAKALGEDLVRKILDMKESDGTSIAEPFIKLPSKRQYPDYYEQIKHPFSLEMVQAKLKGGEYQTLKDVTTDLGQIFNNAKRYNMKDSDLFIWAKKLHKFTRTFYLKSTRPNDHSDSEEPEARRGSAVPSGNARASVDMGDEDVDMGGPSNAGGEDDSTPEGRQKRTGRYMRDGPTTYKLIKPVLKSIREAKARDGSGRDIAEIFEELPDRKLFSDYYQAIPQPISLAEIEEKMVARKYESSDQFLDDVDLMCKNAMTYNEDDSDVFRDAQQIKDIMLYHRNDIKKRIALYQAQQQKAKGTAAAAPTPGARVAGPSSGAYSQMPSVPMPLGPQVPQAAAPNGRPASQAPPQQPPAATASAPAPASYLPALPAGVVTEDIVATLSRYPMYEQQAWAASLPPLAMQVYRQMLASTATRKRIADGQAAGVPPPLADVPSASRPAGSASLPNRIAPPLPTIKSLDFAFSAVGDDPELRQAIRLHNLRGVVSHAVVIGSSTSEIELTAYINAPPTPPSTTGTEVATGGGTDAGSSATPAANGPGGAAPSATSVSGIPAAIEGIPEVSLRVNGNPGTLAKFVYPKGQSEKPHGMRWTIPLPAGRLESKIEVVATKPGSMAETSVIFVSRQF